MQTHLPFEVVYPESIDGLRPLVNHKNQWAFAGINKHGLHVYINMRWKFRLARWLEKDSGYLSRLLN